jgi:hypothetical protein
MEGNKSTDDKFRNCPLIIEKLFQANKANTFHTFENILNSTKVTGENSSSEWLLSKQNLSKFANNKKEYFCNNSTDEFIISEKDKIAFKVK